MRNFRNVLIDAAAAGLVLTSLLSGTGLGQAVAPAPTPEPPDAEKPVEKPAPKPPPTLTIAVGDMTIKFGVLLQAQGDWTQDAATSGYAQNLFLRRARFNVSGKVAKNVFYFMQTENSNLGKVVGGTKVISTGFQLLDAVVEWRIAKEFNLWGGMIYTPTSREALKSSASEFQMDLSAYTFTATAALAGSGGRDTGFMARGYFLGDHLEYRVGAFQGLRDSGSRNPFRTIARLQYNVFDTETYNLPAYPGAYLGAKKILAIGAAYDQQRDYATFTADAYLDVPTSFGSVLGTFTYQNLDGGTFIASLGGTNKSSVLQFDAGAYFKNSKIGPWGRYERRRYPRNSTKDEERVLVGLNYYVSGQNFNVKGAYGRLSPDTGPSTNQFTLLFQAYY